MVDYRIIRYCRACKTRFVIDRTEAKKNYCDKCQLNMKKEERKKK